MKITHASKLVMTSAALVTFLSGCSVGEGNGTSESTPATPTSETNSTAKFESLPEKEAQKWQSKVVEGKNKDTVGDLLVHKDKVVIILRGSSTCPPLVKTVNLDKTFVTVNLKEQKADKACTMDLRSYAWETALPIEDASLIAAGRVSDESGTRPLNFTRITK